jgi:hypothetical protein
MMRWGVWPVLLVLILWMIAVPCFLVFLTWQVAQDSAQLELKIVNWMLIALLAWVWVDVSFRRRQW